MTCPIDTLRDYMSDMMPVDFQLPFKTIKAQGNSRHKEIEYQHIKLGWCPSILSICGTRQTKDWCAHDTEAMEIAAQYHPLAIHSAQGLRGCHINHKYLLQTCRINRSTRDTLGFRDSKVPDVRNCPFNTTTSEHAYTFTLLMPSRRRL